MSERTRKFLAALSILGGLLLPSCGRSHTEAIEIGVVSLSPLHEATVNGFKDAMADLGYVEGGSVRYVYSGPVGTLEGLEAAARDLVEQRVDLLFAVTTPAALAAQKVVEGTDTPVVFTVVNDPVTPGLVASLTHPGGNITGVRVGGMAGKQLEWMTALVPGIRRLYVPHNPDDQGSVRTLAELAAVAPRLGIDLEIAHARTRDDLRAALRSIPRDADGIFLLGSGFLNAQVTDYVEASINCGLPLASMCPCYDRGVLMSYGHDFHRDGEQAARLAHLILEGARPGDLPVETADFFLGVNLQTAEAIGLEVPIDVLQEAHHIVR